MTEAFYLVNGQAIMTAILSGSALGWAFSLIRPGIAWHTFVREGMAVGLLWFVPAMLTRMLDPDLFVNGVRTIGTGLLFALFITVGAATVALLDRRKA